MAGFYFQLCQKRRADCVTDKWPQKKKLKTFAKADGVEKIEKTNESQPVVEQPKAEERPSTLQSLEAIVINLDRRPDRMQECSERLQARCPWLRYSRFSACDGRQTQISETECVVRWNTAKNLVYQRRRSIRKGWDDLHTYHLLHLNLSPGERGCAKSHVQAWRLCLERARGSNKPLLVMEDDAAPTEDFGEKLERSLASTPTDADVLYLGYSQAAEWKREVNEDVVESEYVWTTVGYLIWPAGARTLLDRLPVDQPVDNFMAQAAADGAINAYCIRPKIIRQNDAWNSNSDVGHSDEAYWGNDSDIMHSDDLYWGSATEDCSSTDVPDASSVSDAGPDFKVDGKSCFWNIDAEDSDADSVGDA